MEFADLKTQYTVLRSTIDAHIARVLEHGHYIMGPEVVQLERQLAEYTGAAHCITAASGTEALLMSLMALGEAATRIPDHIAALRFRRRRR